MKKVIVFHEDLLPLSETFIREQVLALPRWNPILVGYRKIGNGLDLAGMNIRLIPGIARGPRRWWLRLCQWLGVAHHPTVRIFREIGADLVHAHFGTDATDIWPSVQAAGLPLLVTLHGYDINIHREWWEAGHGGWHRRHYPRRLLRMAKDPTVHFIAVSRAIRERAIGYGIPADKVTVAYIGINTREFRPGGVPLEQRRKRILFVGRMVEKKAPLLMIQAFAEIRRAVLDAELVMIGDGPLLGDARRLADSLAAPVKFLGALRPGEVQAQMHKARVLCLPSVIAANGDAEGFGLVLLEAQCCGVPVVSSALGGAREGLLDGITGYQCAAGDITAFVSRVVLVLRDRVRAAKMAAAAAAFVADNFDIRQLSKTLEHIYFRSLSDNP